MSHEQDSPSEPLCLDDFEKKAKDKLSDHGLRFYTGGADEELTLRDNVEAYKRYQNIDKHVVVHSNAFIGLFIKNNPMNLDNNSS